MGCVSTEPAPTPVPAPRSTGAATVLARSRADLVSALAESPDPRAVVMTMGALHEGHFDLVREAARRVGPTGTVVVTIFVNPLQFAPTEDLDSYPRDLEGDLDGLTRTLTGADGALGVGRLIVFAPTPEIIYPSGQPAVRIDPGPIATVLEGRTRPTHFAGVCQVVLTLMHLTAPRWALFGRKDAQQLAIIESMVRDLAVPLEIVPVDIRRESDGLAMSSRNAYLSPDQRRQALALSRALQAGRDAAAQGAGSGARPDPADIRRAALASLEEADGVEVDYVALVAPDSFEDLADAGLGLPRSEPAGEGLPATGLLAVAARVGTTRLIDNTLIDLRP
ncbi:pantoate--beta-alanine ligase [Actinomyces sp. oral taxon 171]|uniref:pantoate--beta-alanine ligase n=2 Tax=Actinomyces sp. oral taxon 171 TaxID=706438 RepID=UPI0010FC0DAF|nr:pantoate--beta-alanine ligase [Actinomyces sp. oral taxon 171]QCT32502.1 pantoate--beta-alanine ligase [Actinomyces sp. oral taxon 171 str. F0337]